MLSIFFLSEFSKQSQMSKFSNFQLMLKLSNGIFRKKWGFVVFYSCLYGITSVSWQWWSNYSHTNKLNQQILLFDAKLTQYLLFTQNYEANLLAIDWHMLGFFLIHFQAFIILIHSNMKLASKIWWK